MTYRFSKVGRDLFEVRLPRVSQLAGLMYFRFAVATELRSIPGMMVIRKGAVAEDLRCSLQEVEAAAIELTKEGLVWVDWGSKLAFLPDAIKLDLPANENQVKGWATYWKEFPECELKSRAAEHLKSHLSGALLKAFVERVVGKATFTEVSNGIGNRSGNRSGNRFGNGLANQEQEQEQEQEQKQEPPYPPLGGVEFDLFQSQPKREEPASDEPQPSHALPPSRASHEPMATLAASAPQTPVKSQPERIPAPAPSAAPPRGVQRNSWNEFRSGWIDDYQRIVSASIRAPWAFPRGQTQDLADALATHCLGEDADPFKVSAWLERNLKPFIAMATEKGPNFWSEYGPRGFLKYLNSPHLRPLERPTPRKVQEPEPKGPPATEEQVAQFQETIMGVVAQKSNLSLQPTPPANWTTPAGAPVGSIEHAWGNVRGQNVRGREAERFHQAYEEGISEATGQPYAFPPKAILELSKVLEIYATDIKYDDVDGMLAWTKVNARAFAKAVEGEASVYSNFSPVGFLRWMNRPKEQLTNYKAFEKLEEPLSDEEIAKNLAAVKAMMDRLDEDKTSVAELRARDAKATPTDPEAVKRADALVAQLNEMGRAEAANTTKAHDDANGTPYESYEALVRMRAAGT